MALDGANTAPPFFPVTGVVCAVLFPGFSALPHVQIMNCSVIAGVHFHAVTAAFDSCTAIRETVSAIYISVMHTLTVTHVIILIGITASKVIVTTAGSSFRHTEGEASSPDCCETAGCTDKMESNTAAFRKVHLQQYRIIRERGFFDEY
jgi:hypothetical protein